MQVLDDPFHADAVHKVEPGRDEKLDAVRLGDAGEEMVRRIDGRPHAGALIHQHPAGHVAEPLDRPRRDWLRQVLDIPPRLGMYLVVGSERQVRPDRSIISRGPQPKVPLDHLVCGRAEVSGVIADRVEERQQRLLLRSGRLLALPRKGVAG